MAENHDEIQENIEESDIFEWFASDAELIQDVDNFEEKQSKDMYDYADIAWNSFKVLNIFLVILVLLFWTYIYIQNNEEMTHSSLLSPICWLFLWSVSDSIQTCSSVSAVKKQFTQDLETLKESQFIAISDIIQPLYLSTDFINSSEVVFLYDKSKSRLRPLDILSEFDQLKNGFETEDKSALECSSIEIENNIMSAKCDIYSSDWDTNIVLPSGSTSANIWGTSVSIASSFLDYIESNSSVIRVIDKPKYFSAENVSGENGWYTKRTTFFLQLEYNDTILPL